MIKKQQILRNKAESYLKTIEEATDLFEAFDYPPSRIRAILVKTFEDYFKGKIKEKVLFEVGRILHELQAGTWDYDPDITFITCSLEDFYFKRNLKASRKGQRGKLYRAYYDNLSKSQTISVSLPISLIRKIEGENCSVEEFIKQVVETRIGV